MSNSIATMTATAVVTNDAINDIIRAASATQNLVTCAIAQVTNLDLQFDEWSKAKTEHFRAGDFNAPKPVLWASESYDFDYENDGTITLTFYNDDDSTLIFNATSELTSHIDNGCGYVAFDNLAVTNVIIMDENENSYKVHVTQRLAAEILENYINLAAGNNKIEYSTDLSDMMESAADNASYHRNTHAYYGMSQADF